MLRHGGVRELLRIHRLTRRSIAIERQARIFQQRQEFETKHSAVKEEDAEQEKEAGEKSAGFMKTAVTSVLGEAKEKAKSALGMKEKTLSQSENMGPAGYLENKDPNTDAKEEYSKLKEYTQEQWKSSAGDDAGSKASETDPTSLYRDEKNSAKQNEDPPDPLPQKNSTA